MFCTNCGKPLVAGGRFCPFCGAPAAAPVPMPGMPPPAAGAVRGAPAAPAPISLGGAPAGGSGTVRRAAPAPGMPPPPAPYPAPGAPGAARPPFPAAPGMPMPGAPVPGYPPAYPAAPYPGVPYPPPGYPPPPYAAPGAPPVGMPYARPGGVVTVRPAGLAYGPAPAAGAPGAAPAPAPAAKTAAPGAKLKPSEIMAARRAAAAAAAAEGGAAPAAPAADKPLKPSEIMAARRAAAAGGAPAGATSAAPASAPALAARKKEDAGASAVSPDGRQAGEKLAFELKAGVAVKFVWCPPGMFFMGSPEEEEGRESVERRHSVFITKGFWIGYAPVTQAQWMIIMGNNPSAFDLGTDYPVESVSWNDCQEFVRRLNSGTHGLGTFSLPTEAQWEYACRAGTEAPFATETLAEMAWFADNSDEKTHPVAAKKPNAWGIYDMHGNVCEWCQDVFLEDYPPEEMDPAGPPDKIPGQHPHVLRGGAWCYPAEVCRSAARRSNSPDFAAQILGLRLVFNPATHDPHAGGPKFRRKA